MSSNISSDNNNQLFAGRGGQWRIQDFPKGGRELSKGGAWTRNFAKFSQKLHEIERIWTQRGGACVPHAPP